MAVSNRLFSDQQIVRNICSNNVSFCLWFKYVSWQYQQYFDCNFSYARLNKHIIDHNNRFFVHPIRRKQPVSTIVSDLLKKLIDDQISSVYIYIHIHMIIVFIDFLFAQW